MNYNPLKYLITTFPQIFVEQRKSANMFNSNVSTNLVMNNNPLKYLITTFPKIFVEQRKSANML